MAAVNKIIAYYGIGSGSNSSRRFVQFVSPQRGWSGFVDDHLKPMMRGGVRRFLLWMPHGREAKSRQQLMGNKWITTHLRYDSYLLARNNPAHNWFTQGFAEAIYPITSQGVEVIAYVGTLHGAPEFNSLSGGQIKWQAMKAIAPLLDARCSIALDTSIFSKPGHYVYDFSQSLRQSGYKLYIEPTPYVDAPQWFNTPCVVSNAQWAAVSNPLNHNLLAAPSKLKGEIIRGWFESRPTTYPTIRAWYNWTVPPAIASGHTCCLPLTEFVASGGKLEDLLR